MIKRRELNKLFLASALLPCSLESWSGLVAAEKKHSHRPLHFIYDNNAIACGLKEKPALNNFDAVHCINGDVTLVWYEQLHFLWQKKNILTAGLTRESEFFVLKTLARDYGYSVKEEQHDERSHFVYWLLGPEDHFT